MLWMYSICKNPKLVAGVMGERLRVETDFANSPGLFSSMHTGRKHLPVALIPEDPMNSLSL